jgi:hypothetical protein
VGGKRETITFRLHEEDGQLTIDKTKEANFLDSSVSLKYDEINFVEVVEFGAYHDLSGKKRTVQISISTPYTTYVGAAVILPTEADANAVAEYIARKSPLHLELIAGAWRVRKPFQCPEGDLPGCKDFKELLDHDDPEIAGYFYSTGGEHVYACFENEGNGFLVVEYYGYPSELGRFSLKSFLNGQSNMVEFRKINWYSDGNGEITEIPYQAHGQKPQTLGFVDSSSLSYHTKFTNRWNKTLQYDVSIRWATGRFTENWSGKDDDGKPFNESSSGICVKLN